MPRYLATASQANLEETLRLADELNAATDSLGSVALVQCGRASSVAADIAQLLTRGGRRSVSIIVTHRDQAQSDRVVQRLAGASTVWVFADDLLETFQTAFATRLAFALRSAASEGLPVVGIGGGALALGGLLLASRVCRQSRYELVTGLGWAPRVLVDGGADRGILDGEIARASVRSLPGLLGVDLGLRGGLRVHGWRVESVGEEPVLLFGADDAGTLLTLPLDPGQVTAVAPPPFAPFTRGLVSPRLLETAKAHPQPERKVAVRQAPEPEEPPAGGVHRKPSDGSLCPMCHKVHAPDPRLVLAA